MSNLPWEFVIVGTIILVALIASKRLPNFNFPKLPNLGQKPLYIALGGLVIGGLIFADYQEWISIPPINRANLLPWLMLGFALFSMGVMLTTSWGREVLGGVVFIAGIISALILLFLAVFFPKELAEMFSLQPDEDVIIKRLRLEHDYTYELEPGDVRGFDRTRDDWCILFTWEEPVPASWYDDWTEDGGDEYYLQNRHRVPVTVTVRMVYVGDVWQGKRCR